jgi:hypothetical protein
MKNYFSFLLGFVAVFGVTLFFFTPVASSTESVCSVYFNARSQTRIAYSCPGKLPIVIPGNEDVVEIISQKIIPLLPFYIQKIKISDISSNPSVITIGDR